MHVTSSWQPRQEIGVEITGSQLQSSVFITSLYGPHMKEIVQTCKDVDAPRSKPLGRRCRSQVMQSLKSKNTQRELGGGGGEGVLERKEPLFAIIPFFPLNLHGLHAMALDLAQLSS